MQVCCSFCLSGLLHGTYWKNYRFFKGVQRGVQKPLWITRELLISNVFRNAKVLPPHCKSPNPLWGTGAQATVRCRRTKPATRAGESSASNAKVLGIRRTTKTWAPRPSESWSMQRS
jgi:hypothetical protein